MSTLQEIRIRKVRYDEDFGDKYPITLFATKYYGRMYSITPSPFSRESLSTDRLQTSNLLDNTKLNRRTLSVRIIVKEGYKDTFTDKSWFEVKEEANNIIAELTASNQLYKVYRAINEYETIAKSQKGYIGSLSNYERIENRSGGTVILNLTYSLEEPNLISDNVTLLDMSDGGIVEVNFEDSNMEIIPDRLIMPTSDSFITFQSKLSTMQFGTSYRFQKHLTTTIKNYYPRQKLDETVKDISFINYIRIPRGTVRVQASEGVKVEYYERWLE